MPEETEHVPHVADVVALDVVQYDPVQVPGFVFVPSLHVPQSLSITALGFCTQYCPVHVFELVFSGSLHEPQSVCAYVGLLTQY